MPQYRLIDSWGSELCIVSDDREAIDVGNTVTLPDGRTAEVLDVYDDVEHGREGGVAASLALDVE